RNYGFEVLREQCVVRTGDDQVSWFNRNKGTFKSNVGGLKPSLEPCALGLPVVGGEARFAPVLRALAGMRTYQIEPSKLREMQDPESGSGLQADGSNAASVLRKIARRSPDDFERICELLEAIVPHTKRVRPVKQGN